MKIMRFNVFVTALLMNTCLATDANAYIDLGSGSLLIQMFLAGLFGALFTLKMYFKQVKRFFLNIFKKEEKSNHHER